ncbi:hypothetical protein B0H66DRAFT_99751 [Apodospora peruviana]|uniref:Uncharacterized protein n=1 Tax=Apodospora peruviana TaxID=516989 RepID=A0AAE0HSM1_9PEZI|nr:hypothetical protein B0H66DRAFT_99751 [Apodospora peruviana]
MHEKYFEDLVWHAACLLLVTLYVVPKLHVARYLPLQSRLSERRDLIAALISLSLQTLGLTALGLFVHQAAHVYFVAMLLAAGLSAPSFIKAYFVNSSGGFEGDDDKSMALAESAIMETLGSLLCPVVLSGLQTFSRADGAAVFLIAAGMGAVSFALLVLGSLL